MVLTDALRLNEVRPPDLAGVFRPLDERRAFMDRSMIFVLEGHQRENHLSQAWLDQMSLFLRLIQMQELMHYLKDLDTPDEELQTVLQMNTGD